MRGERRRQIAALGAAIGIHLVAAALGGWLLLEHEEQLLPGVVEVAVLGDSGSESGAASGKTGDTAGAGSHFRDMGQNAGAAVMESAGKASPADSTSWRGGRKGVAGASCIRRGRGLRFICYWQDGSFSFRRAYGKCWAWRSWRAGRTGFRQRRRSWWFFRRYGEQFPEEWRWFLYRYVF